MKFGKVDDPSHIDFTLPPDHPDTRAVFNQEKTLGSPPKIYVGCAKWNKTDLKNFYPRGTKDELIYYSSQFNSIELNSSFYRIFPAAQVQKWYDKTPDTFRFFPKVVQDISHYRQLKDVQQKTDEFLVFVSHFKDKLGGVFLQLHDRFSPKNMDRLQAFLSQWPIDVPLTVELRHTEWFNDPAITNELCQFLASQQVGNMVVDTAGRRDILHMRLTNSRPFVRFVGANHPSDYTRLDAWVNRIEQWVSEGMSELDFFIHQNMELSSPLLAAYFIEALNNRLGTQLTVPASLIDNRQQGMLL